MKIIMNRHAPTEMVTFHIGSEESVLIEKEDLNTWEDEGGSLLTEIKYKKLYYGDWSQISEDDISDMTENDSIGG